MGKAMDRMDDLEQRIAWLENEVKELSKRPISGRRPLRLQEATAWLRTRGSGSIADIMDEAKMRGFSYQLVRKAKRVLNWKRVGNRWVKQ